MKHLLTILILFCTLLFSCKSIRSEMDIRYLYQNIDSVKSCDIVVLPEIKIIKVGNSYTATYKFNYTGEVWFVTPSGYWCDFHYNETKGYFNDSCELKERMRSFIKLKLVGIISDKLYSK